VLALIVGAAVVATVVGGRLLVGTRSDAAVVGTGASLDFEPS
jgi:hypothetical protein